MQKTPLSARVRSLLLIMSCVSLAEVAAAQSTNPAQIKQFPVKKLFGYYDVYLAIPPSGRDGFKLNYRIQSSQANAQPRLTYVNGQQRIPVELNSTGHVQNLPTAQMLQTWKIEAVSAGEGRNRISLDLDPIVPLGRIVPAAAVANATSDYAAALGRAGPLALMMPKLSGVRFLGATRGVAVFPDGRRVALPLVDGANVFRPADAQFRAASQLEFPIAPTAAEFAR